MVVGFNHNFRYKGEMYHVQTEDGGRKNPHIVTLLYQGGTILASRKTSYADIIKAESLEQVVEELMKEQHREMLRRLKNGEFDAVIEGRKAGATSSAAALPPAADFRPGIAVPALSPTQPEPAPQVVQPFPGPAVRPAAPGLHSPASELEPSLDEIILSYLAGDDGKD